MKSRIKDFAIILVIAALFIIIMFTSVKNRKQEDVNMTVAVHIKGEVNKPGYYELEYGSRIKNVIDKAGGTTDKANLNSVNLAAKLRDGEEVIIPSKIAESSNEESVAENSAININTADIDTLCKLDGIGINTAEAIINYRKNNGTFIKIEDLKNVEGIGEAKFAAIRDKITV